MQQTVMVAIRQSQLFAFAPAKEARGPATYEAMQRIVSPIRTVDNAGRLILFV